MGALWNISLVYNYFSCPPRGVFVFGCGQVAVFWFLVFGFWWVRRGAWEIFLSFFLFFPSLLSFSSSQGRRLRGRRKSFMFFMFRIKGKKKLGMGLVAGGMK